MLGDGTVGGVEAEPQLPPETPSVWDKCPLLLQQPHVIGHNVFRPAASDWQIVPPADPGSVYTPLCVHTDTHRDLQQQDGV